MHMSLMQLARTVSSRVSLASERHIAAHIPLNGLAVHVHLPLAPGHGRLASHRYGRLFSFDKQAVITVRYGSLDSAASPDHCSEGEH